MNSLLSIGEMAELNQISIQTLRYYDRINLLAPIEINKKNGYRYYTIEQSYKLDMIHLMQQLGFSLNQIKKQFQENDMNTLHSLLHSKQKELVTQQDILQQKQRQLERYIKALHKFTNSTNNEEIHFTYFNERYLYSYPVLQVINDYYSFDYFFRKLKASITHLHILTNSFQNCGMIIRKPAFKSAQFLSNELCVFLTDSTIHMANEKIDANNYAYVYCQSFAEEKRMAEKLYNYIEEHNLEIIGDYICEVLLEAPIFNENTKHVFLRLQVPIKLP